MNPSRDIAEVLGALRALGCEVEDVVENRVIIRNELGEESRLRWWPKIPESEQFRVVQELGYDPAVYLLRVRKLYGK